MKEDNDIDIMELTIKECPLFYYMVDKSCQETCACWKWEFSEGWFENARLMSYKLEALNNIVHPKTRVRIQMDLMKEKYGMLTVYYSVVVDPSPLKTWLRDKVWYKLYKKLCSLDYKRKSVVDIEPYDYDEKKNISREEYEKELNGIKCSNVEYVISDDKLTITRIVHLHNYGKSHCEPTKHRLLYKLMNFCHRRFYGLHKSVCDMTAKLKCAYEYLYEKANEIIHDAEELCAKTCEKCGHSIASEWSPTCTTTGWITYICEDCAKKSAKDYIKNGDLCNSGNVIKTKKELAAEKKKRETEYKKAEAERKREVEQKMKEFDNEIAN